jgi:hypothetical protein
MKNSLIAAAMLFSAATQAQKMDPALAQLPYNLLGQDSVGLRQMAPAFLALEENTFIVQYTPFLITAELETISRDNMERRVTTVNVTATDRKQQKAIQKAFPGKYVVDTSGFNPLNHPMGLSAIIEASRSRDTVQYEFRLVPDKLRLPDYSKWMPFIGAVADSFLTAEDLFYVGDESHTLERGERHYSIDTTDEGQLGYRVDYNSDVDVILYRLLDGAKGGEVVFVPYKSNLLKASREMFKYYFPQFVDGDADFELRIRIEGEGASQRYFLGTQSKENGVSHVQEFTRQEYLDLLEEVSAG